MSQRAIGTLLAPMITSTTPGILAASDVASAHRKAGETAFAIERPVDLAGRGAWWQAKGARLHTLAATYSARGRSDLEAGQALAEAVMAATGGSPQNPFAALTEDYQLQTRQYQAMSTLAYWQDFYAHLGAQLDDVEATYRSHADDNDRLARQHADQAALARNAADHPLLVGSDGTILQEHYQYDRIGRLTTRSDYAVDLFESFDYDALGRLTQSRLSGEGASLYQAAGLEVVHYDYDALGNLLAKSDVGQYRYGSGQSGAAGPHAVTAIDRPDGGTDLFAYDDNGNLESGPDHRTKETGSDLAPCMARTG